jgi:hypothetical protein
MTHYLLWLALGAGPISVCPCARPRRPSARASNPQAPQHLCPCVALTECLHPGHEPPAGLPPFSLGIFPIPLFHCREGRRGKRGGGGGSAATAPCRGYRGAAGVQEAGAEEGPLRDDDARREEQSEDTAAAHHYTAPSSSPSRPRLHRRPNVSAAVAVFTSPLPWSLTVMTRQRRGTSS